MSKTINTKEIVKLALDEIKQEHRMKEHFISISLDARNEPIKTSLISMGTLNANLVHPREVFYPNLKARAAAFVVLHNHPSGGLGPSEADIMVTDRLKECGELLGIELQDHIIFSTNGKHKSCMNN